MKRVDGDAATSVVHGLWKLAIVAQPEGMGKGVANDATNQTPRLYYLDREIGERTNLAEKHPKIDKVTKSVALETLKPGDTVVSSAATQVSGKAFTISCTVETTQRDAIVLTHGGLSAGYALHLKAGRVAFVVRTGAGDSFAELVTKTEVTGPARITAVLASDATMILTVDDQPAVTGKADSLIPRQPAEDFCLGHDSGVPVATYTAKGPFKGAITDLEITPP